MTHAILISDSELFCETLMSKLSSLDYQVSHYDDFDEMIKNTTYFFVIDLASFKMNNVQLDQFAREYNIPIIALTPLPRFDQAVHLLKLGIKGYMSTYTSLTNMRGAIKSILEGGMWFDPGVIQEIISNLSLCKTEKESNNEGSILTERESLTARYVSQGVGNKEIALQLDITERTVKAHILSCYQKLGLHDRVSLALWAKRVFND